MAFLSYHLHWSHDDAMNLEHRDRREWVRQVSTLNDRANSDEREHV